MIAKAKAFFLAQLTQGVSPHSLALACAIGASFGVFPLFGTTTTLAFLVGLALRLNQPALQGMNYLMGPLQLVLIPVFLRAGEWITGAPPQALNPSVILKEFWADIPLFFANWGGAALRAVLAWGIFTPPAAFLLYLALRFFLARILNASKLERGESK
jgi:uncharacterized protein (DUF2062 family)